MCAQSTNFVTFNSSDFKTAMPGNLTLQYLQCIQLESLSMWLQHNSNIPVSGFLAVLQSGLWLQLKLFHNCRGCSGKWSYRGWHTSDLRTTTQLTPKFVCLFVCLFFFYPEGFTIFVTNEDPEKARAYLNQIPWDQRLYIPSKGCVWTSGESTFRICLLTSLGRVE